MPEKLPEKLEELDLMRLLAVTREIELYDAQITIFQMKIREANRVNAALHASLREKYSLTERDQIDGLTGVIARYQTIVKPAVPDMSNGQ
jgi:hypothetical protein